MTFLPLADDGPPLVTGSTFPTNYSGFAFVPLAFAESVSLILTSARTIQVYKAEYGGQLKISPLIKLIIRDNILYLLV